MVWIGIILIVAAFAIFINATEKIKYGEFNHSSWWLMCFGIYQWGQGLILSGFWMLYGLGCVFWWTPNQAMRGYVLFHVIRAVIELFLVASSKYRGLLSNIPHDEKKISEEQLLQLYILGHGIIILCGLMFLPLLPTK